MIYLTKGVSVKFMYIVLILFFQFSSVNADEMTVTKCEGVQGLQVVTDYSSSGKPFVRKDLTEIFTSFSNDFYFTNLAIDSSKFSSGNIEITIDVLNKDSKTIKKYVLNKWITDKNVSGKKISKIPISRFIKSKISRPFDNYLNLSKAEKSKINILTIPVNAKFNIGQKNKKPFCVFDFKYGSATHED